MISYLAVNNINFDLDDADNWYPRNFRFSEPKQKQKQHKHERENMRASILQLHFQQDLFSFKVSQVKPS